MSVVCLLAAASGSATAADSPVVFGYEQMRSPQTADAQRPADSTAGRLLLMELRCVACHAPSDSLKAQSAPPSPVAVDLSEVGARLGVDALREWLLSPSSVKPGTTMPACFAPGDADRNTVDALASYLSSLQGSQPPQSLAGDRERGRELYHSVGCVACHAPEPREGVVAAVRSVPIALGKRYPAAVLAQFLQEPLRLRPHGRMPSLNLSAQEAADVSAYLQRDGVPSAPSTPAQPELRELGRKAFAERGCVACHSDGSGVAHSKTVAPLTALRVGKGCLSESVPAGVPNYQLDPAQRQALNGALASLSENAGGPLALMQFNCLACHVRDGRGGPEVARLPFFTANDPGAESLGELGHLPPRLDGVGAKLTSPWMAKMLWEGNGGVRPYLNTRMPLFGRANVETLPAWFTETDRNPTPVDMDVSGVHGHQRGTIGRQLVGTKGLSCVSCHGILGRKSMGPTVLHLTHATERLQPEYFKRLLLNPQQTQPGTLMPPLFTGRKNADNEIESIWTYLREAVAHPLPEGLLSEGDFELKPKEAGRPIVFRSFIEGAGTHAIAVGFPEGVHICFDPVACRWTVAWKGRFLDALNNWKERSMPPIAPLGEHVRLLVPENERAAAAGVRQFLGYKLDGRGVPTMLYRVGTLQVEDRVEPSADGGALSRSVRTAGGAAEGEAHVPSLVAGELQLSGGKQDEVLSW